MGWLLGFVVFVILVAGYLLMAPIYVEIDSVQGFCRIRFHKLASASLVSLGESLGIKWRIAGWGKTLDVLSLAGGKSKPPAKGKKQSPSPAKSASRRSMPLKTWWAILRSFTVRKCDVSLDTGDMPANGMLYPAFLWLSARSRKNIRINFWGENEVLLVVENRLGRIVWAYLTGK